MRLLNLFLLLASLGSLALAREQATVIQGYATTTGPAGIVTGPFVPLLATPEVSLDTPALATGASNATSGLVAGATNSTLASDLPAPEAEDASSVSDRGLSSGLASYEGNIGVAALLGAKAPNTVPAHAYTNDDIDRLNQQTGTVKFKGKTEELP